MLDEDRLCLAPSMVIDFYSDLFLFFISYIFYKEIYLFFYYDTVFPDSLLFYLFLLPFYSGVGKYLDCSILELIDLFVFWFI